MTQDYVFRSNVVFKQPKYGIQNILLFSWITMNHGVYIHLEEFTEIHKCTSRQKLKLKNCLSFDHLGVHITVNQQE